MRWTGTDNYPSYDIERAGENHYRISLAVAGFAPEDTTITAEQNMLTVEGRKADNGDHEYLYRGISARPFRHVFSLADDVEAKSATFESGLLMIDLVRNVPEAMKPAQIAIGAPANDNQAIEHQKAA
jgi:molecular chaperone IbpA